MRRALTLSLVAVSLSAIAAEEAAPKSPSDISPDGRFLVQRFAEAIQMIDIRSQQRYPETGVLPGYIVRWMPDSRTAVALQHVHGGSLATAVHFDGAEWQKFDTTPSDRYFDYVGVVDLRPDDRSLRVVYRSDVRGDDHQSTHFLVTIDVDFAAGAMREHAKPISYQRYARLHDVAQP